MRRGVFDRLPTTTTTTQLGWSWVGGFLLELVGVSGRATKRNTDIRIMPNHMHHGLHRMATFVLDNFISCRHLALAVHLPRRGQMPGRLSISSTHPSAVPKVTEGCAAHYLAAECRILNQNHSRVRLLNVRRFNQYSVFIDAFFHPPAQHLHMEPTWKVRFGRMEVRKRL
ncbi:hypothetical protein FA95DRAFT_805299 [Auriscalpium vulgare]|uniref:Uncharacterized protein n=1 Tax=Auriscalpium vulgare TaxID=40419 RepID=A0ACB8R9V6_9AGAM|nr:hypothetical protein FA95DRAFT_805299 [Auriscalpium vulgare]